MFTWFAKLAIPRWVWGLVGGLALIGLGLWWHSRAVTKYGKEQFAAGVVFEAKRIEARVKSLAAQAEEVSRNAQELAQTDFARIRGSARTVLLRGPGKAACGPTVPFTASQPLRPDTTGSVAMAPMPAREGEPLFGLPANSAVVLAQNHDLCWAREKAWVAWHKAQSEIWRKSN